jgi:glycosyltransferase involved in cell wall biosynthesis
MEWENQIKKISVVFAVYNSEAYLKEAIDSVLSQTFEDFEFIIINDGSTDSSTEIILSYKDPRIVYMDNGSNKGLIYSLNVGISKSRGKYIARMDADDIALPQRLQVQYDFMEAHPEIGICGANIETFFDNSKEKLITRFPEDDRTVRAYTFFQSPFCHPTVMMRKAVLEKNKIEYPKDFFRTEDYAMWVEMLQYTQAHNIQSVLLRYRKHEGSETWISGHTNKENYNFCAIQRIYFQHNHINLDSEYSIPFSCFANRSVGYPLTKENQLLLDKIYEDFFIQLERKQKPLVILAKQFVATACFYHFLKSKKYPKTRYLRKLYWLGAFTFLKKSLTFVRRKINGE